MKREFKFRVWDGNEFVYWGFIDGGFFSPPSGQVENGVILNLKYTKEMSDEYIGKKCRDKEVYVHDIIRIEENLDDGVEFHYYVVEWIQEWCMFALLRQDDEWPEYCEKGIQALDIPMYWTYPIEHMNSDKFFLHGNIYENVTT